MAAESKEESHLPNKGDVFTDPGTTHLEGDQGHKENGMILKSSHDDLGVWATAKRFKKVR